MPIFYSSFCCRECYEILKSIQAGVSDNFEALVIVDFFKVSKCTAAPCGTSIASQL